MKPVTDEERYEAGMAYWKASEALSQLKYVIGLCTNLGIHQSNLTMLEGVRAPLSDIYHKNLATLERAKDERNET